MTWKRSATWVILAVLALLIKIFSFFPDAVEKYYSGGFYAFISRLLRLLFGWIPFSVGDIFYAAFSIWLIVKIISFARKLVNKRIKPAYLKYLVGRLLSLCLIIYISFNLLWGLNYERRGIAYQLQLNIQPYSTPELQTVLELIVERLNGLDSAAIEKRATLHTKKDLFSGSVRQYQALHKQNNLFQYQSASVKPSIFSYLGNYLGFTGYYNPFSGEAQVNTTVPLFIQPFTTCHEIGHQLGYAKENEANFAGYLAATAAEDTLFAYSAYFDLYIYAASELYMRDSTLLKPIREQLKPAIREDFKTLRKFYAKYENPIEPYIRRLYGRYLKANGQMQGIRTYNEVMASLIAYYRKFGKEAL